MPCYKLAMRRRLVAPQALWLLPLVLFHGLCESDVLTAPMEQRELDALYMVLGGFVGKDWNGSELYPDPCGWTPIQGVSCDLFNEFWYITAINIGPVLDNSLLCAGCASFSPFLFELKHLKSLSFFNCFSSREPITIPSTNWEKLSASLETLEFRSNRGLIGEIPSSLGRLTSLQSLVLVENALTGSLPQELGNLAHLRRLSLAGNALSGPIPASLGYNMNELLILDLSRNAITGSIPASLGGMTALLKLDLSTNHLDGMLPRELGKLQKLTLLDLRNNNLSGGLIQSLQSMVSLQDMLLSNNPLGGSIIHFGWQKLSDLTNLDLANIGVTGEIPESMVNLERLRFIALNNNKVEGSVPSKLAALPSLNALYLNGNNLTGWLLFPEVFYERLGRRFAAWDNPNLCYSAAGVSRGHVPIGVERCKREETVSNYNSGSENISGMNSSPMTSSGASNAHVGGFWCAILMQLLCFGAIARERN